MTYALKFISMLALVLMPVREVMIAVGVLVLADLVTGIMASRKEKQPITSTGLKKTVGKTLAYQSAIIVGFVMEHYLLQGVPVVRVVAGLIAITEGKSFFENLKRITGIDVWSEVLKRIQEASTVAKQEKSE